MTTKAAKGNQFQDWCAGFILEAWPGSVVHNQKAVAKTIKVRDPKTGELVDRWVSQRNDIFGCIDILAILPAGYIIFIQCTLDRGLTRKLQDVLTVPWPLNRCNVELWVKRGPGKVDLFLLDHGSQWKKYGRIERRKIAYEFG